MNFISPLVDKVVAANPNTNMIPPRPVNIPQGNFGSLTGDIINIIFVAAGAITLVVIVFLGYQMFTSKGKDEEFKKALQGISYAALGLTILGLAYAIVIAFMNFLSQT